jgi:hypothetical protein
MDKETKKIKKYHIAVLQLARKIVLEAGFKETTVTPKNPFIEETLVGIVYANILTDYRNKYFMEQSDKKFDDLMGPLKEMLG